MLRPTKPPDATKLKLIEKAKGDAPTYSEVGETCSDAFPPGYVVDHHEERIGPPEAFETAAEALRTWTPQRDAGLEVFPADASVREGETFLLILHAGPMWATAPCRVIYTIDEPDRVGYAYATLPGHPERGEVRFTVSRESDGTVFRIASFSRSALPFGRLGRPFSRRLQVRVTRDYITALAAACNRVIST